MKMSGLFWPLRLTSAFLLLFLWIFLPHRYRKLPSLGIALASYLLTGVLEAAVSGHVARSIDLYGTAALLIEVLVVLATAMLLGEHRDSRSLFVGLSACTYALAAFIAGSLVYYHTGCPLTAILAQTLFSGIVLAVLCMHNRRTPLTDLLADPTGRARLCLVPLVCLLSIFIASVWPGNLFVIPVCRIISVLMLVLMFVYYHLVIMLLRIQANRGWLQANNEIMNAYAQGLKQQIERTAKDQEKLSVLRHDSRHRASLIRYYLDEGNTDAIREMCDQVSACLNETVEGRYCADTALNWVLGSFAPRAEEKKIRFECAAEIPPLPEALELEFGTVMLNLLENAFNAAAAVDEGGRFVCCTVRPVKGQVFLTIDNSYRGALRFSPVTKLPLSDKGEGHGYGLRSVLAFAQRHQATFSCTAEGNVFHTRLLLLRPEGL